MCSEKMSLQRGDIVMDTDDHHMLVLRELRGSGDDIVYECADLSEVEWVGKESDELLEIVDSKDVNTYQYHRSFLTFY